MSTELDNVLAEALKDAVGGAAGLTGQQQATVSAIAIQLLDAKAKLSVMETELKEQAEKVKDLEERQLPAALADMGMLEFTMEDGSKVSRETVYTASIRVDDKPWAYQWLRDTDNDSLIKAEVKIPFGKGDLEKAEWLINMIRKTLEEKGLGNSVELQEDVHWATMRAFVKEQIIEEDRAIAAGELDPEKDKAKLFPRELFGVYIFERAKVVPKKEKKAKKS